MPRSLTGRIALAFGVLIVATWIAVGGALFVVLRSLHSDATSSTLVDVATPIVAQARPRLLGGGEVQATVAELRAQIEGSSYSMYVQTADGRLVAVRGEPVSPASISVSATAVRGATDRGTYLGSDGTTYAWAAVMLRNPGQLGPRAVVLATPDTSASQAFRDLVAAFPAVAIVSLLVGAPITVFLARSVTLPLRRLADATADLPRGTRAALPLEGPGEIRELIHRFNAMADELTETRRGETELIANLRHDLRTPVTVIAGFAEALTDGTATGDDVGRASRAIREEADRLEHLVGELGAVEQLQAGAGGLRPEPMDVDDLLAATVERFRPQAAAQGVEIGLTATAAGTSGSSGPRLWMVADRLALERALANLVTNSLSVLAKQANPAAAPSDRAVADGSRSPAQGHVWLAARPLASSAPRGRGPERISLEVTDDGPGFPPGSTERVFERFYRADPARTGAGGGLGLTIVRELARAHGGDAVAENLVPRGARVSLIIPVVPASTTGNGPPPPAS